MIKQVHSVTLSNYKLCGYYFTITFTSRKRVFKVSYGSLLNLDSFIDVKSDDVESIQIRCRFPNRSQIFTHHVDLEKTPTS